MKKRLSVGSLLLSVLLVFLLCLAAEAVVHRHLEDFSTTQYQDTLNTTAWWDTVGGEIKLFPFELTLAGSYDTLGSARGVAIAGDYAYVIDGDAGLVVVDISDPAAPVWAGYYDTPGWANGVAIAGDYAYVACDDAGLVVVDISDPTAPVWAGGYDTPYRAHALAIAGDHAYLACYAAGLVVVEVFQRAFSLEKNTGRSLVVSASGEEIPRARLAATQLDSIGWELSADGGTSWEGLTPGGGWCAFATPGSSLVWRSEHVYAGQGVNPACSDLEIEWLYNFAVIDSIVDVPDDQGGWARVHFTRSGRDFADEPTYPISGYYIFRRIEDLFQKARMIGEAKIVEKGKRETSGARQKTPVIPASARGSGSFYLNDGHSLISEGKSDGLPPGTWEVVDSLLALGEDQYSCLVPTVADSCSTLTYSVYCIQAQTDTPSVSYFSPPDSGYSKDNVNPAKTQVSVMAAGSAKGSVGTIWLTWDQVSTGVDGSSEPGPISYRVYCDEDPNFTPGPGNLLTTTADLSYAHTDARIGDPAANLYYVVTVLDGVGNESAVSNVVGEFDKSLASME